MFYMVITCFIWVLHALYGHYMFYMVITCLYGYYMFSYGHYMFNMGITCFIWVLQITVVRVNNTTCLHVTKCCKARSMLSLGFVRSL